MITLTIIGVIAAITIPTLMKKWEDQHTVSAVKEAYAILGNAIRMTINENGPLYVTQPSATDLQNMISQHLKVKEQMVDGKNCDYGYSISGANISKNTNPKASCGYMKALGGGYSSGNAIRSQNALLLENGMIFKIHGTGPTHIGDFYILWADINGKKAPDQFGVDIFWFYLFRPNNKLSPAYPIGGWYNCDRNSNSWTSGMACTDWVIKKGNLDYKYN